MTVGYNALKFYTGSHKFYCGVDLHSRSMFICVLDERGYPLLEKNIKTDPRSLSPAITPVAPLTRTRP